MAQNTGALTESVPIGFLGRLRNLMSGWPTLAWLIGALAAVVLERFVGYALATSLGFSKIPMLFGCVIMLGKPIMIPSAFVYVALIYALPMIICGRFLGPLANSVAEKLMKLPFVINVILYLALLFAVLHIWAGVSDYRLLTLKLTLIAVIVTLSLNLINGYQGEFSCSHPGFMALGAYGASVFTLILFVDDKIFGAPLLPAWLGPVLFPLGLVAGGLVASIGALVVAIPSFRTRGDYLAIISLAFLFIVKSLIENLEIVGGPRGLGSQPDWASLPTVFVWTVLAVWMMNNFVRSTMGKAINAIRDDEEAAEAMTVNTRRTKMINFMFAAFWAGVAGGLFAHVLRYVNPGTFGIKKLAEVLAMVYFGGLNSVVGSIVGAVSLNVLSEALRPLQIFKWIIIPLLLILIMIYRPTGLIAFREFDARKILSPRKKPEREV